MRTNTNSQQAKDRKTDETSKQTEFSAARTASKFKKARNETLTKLQRKANRKEQSDIHKEHLSRNHSSPFHHKYEESLNCCSHIKWENGKQIVYTCKKMWCITCQAILACKRWNRYKDQLAELPELQFTTLTAENCSRGEIKKLIKIFRKFFHNWREKYVNRYGVQFSGVYNFEITINEKKRQYHVHMHITHEGLTLIESETIKYGKKVKCYINDICSDWLLYSKKRGIKTNLKAQDARPIKYVNGEPQLKETFKYQTKGINSIKTKNGKKPIILVEELDAMYQELEGLHLFQAFGKLKKVEEDETNEPIELDTPEGTYKWESEKHDWILTQYIDPITNEIYENDTPEIYIKKEIPLSGYQPSDKELNYFQSLRENKHYKPTG